MESSPAETSALCDEPPLLAEAGPAAAAAAAAAVETAAVCCTMPTADEQKALDVSLPYT